MADANAIYKRVTGKFYEAEKDLNRVEIVGGETQAIIWSGIYLGKSIVLAACIIAEALKNGMDEQEGFNQQTYEKQGGGK